MGSYDCGYVEFYLKLKHFERMPKPLRCFAVLVRILHWHRTILINAIINCNRTPTSNPYPQGKSADAFNCVIWFHMKDEKGARKPHWNHKVKIYSSRLSLYLWHNGIYCKLFFHLEKEDKKDKSFSAEIVDSLGTFFFFLISSFFLCQKNSEEMKMLKEIL